MKTYLIIAMLVIFSYNLFSQNTEPAAFEFNYSTNSFTQSKFIYGFQWAASKNMNDEQVPIFGNLYSSQHFFNECNDEYRMFLCSYVKLYNMEVS